MTSPTENTEELSDEALGIDEPMRILVDFTHSLGVEVWGTENAGWDEYHARIEAYKDSKVQEAISAHAPAMPDDKELEIVLLDFFNEQIKTNNAKAFPNAKQALLAWRERYAEEQVQKFAKMLKAGALITGKVDIDTGLGIFSAIAEHKEGETER